jgi:hypothetical protein
MFVKGVVVECSSPRLRMRLEDVFPKPVAAPCFEIFGGTRDSLLWRWFQYLQWPIISQAMKGEWWKER